MTDSAFREIMENVKKTAILNLSQQKEAEII